ncbi:unnamed protein product [Paramecium primaurelia]|uniref:Protein phosphatase n=1 Tax=Paramecium primaurelia TaxID=5886 RepID=A0A8S1KG37_PARPR|nr:unnamed protein product [Paramecium primaurelia]
MIFILFIIEVYSLQFQSFVHIIPHPDKVAKGGEDAYYANENLLAVADGVGGWNNHGVDPSKYSKTLCENIKEYSHLDNPKQIMQIASELTNHILGSSTLVIMKLIDNVLKVANIGDCGYTIIRNQEILHQSEEQQHSFNFPFQLGSQGDSAQLAQEFEHVLQINDILIVGSDGLYDNLDQNQILNLINEYGVSQKSAQLLAKTSFQYSLDKTYNSPFAQRAQKSRIRFIGGKSDDITVIVARIINNNEL